MSWTAITDRLDRASQDAVTRATHVTAAPPPRETTIDPGGALRRAVSLDSPTVHHAVRVAITAIVAVFVGRAVSPSHVGWVVITAIAVLQPYPGATLTRATERVIGTAIGGVVALALSRAVHAPLPLALAMLVLSTAAMLTRVRSYRLFVVFLTPVFLLVADHLHASWPSMVTRLGDVAIGGALAIVATAFVPAWERKRLPVALGGLLASLERYFEAALDAFEAGHHRSQALATARRDVGRALEEAEASLDRMLSEPRRVRGPVERAVFLLTYGRRLSAALTTLDALEAPVSRDDAERVRAYLAHALATARARIDDVPPPPPQEPPTVGDALARLVQAARRLATT